MSFDHIKMKLKQSDDGFRMTVIIDSELEPNQLIIDSINLILTTLRSVFKAEAETTKKKMGRKFVPSPILRRRKNRKKLWEVDKRREEGSARPEGPTQTDLCVGCLGCFTLVGWGSTDAPWHAVIIDGQISF